MAAGSPVSPAGSFQLLSPPMRCFCPHLFYFIRTMFPSFYVQYVPPSSNAVCLTQTLPISNPRSYCCSSSTYCLRFTFDVFSIEMVDICIYFGTCFSLISFSSSFYLISSFSHRLTPASQAFCTAIRERGFFSSAPQALPPTCSLSFSFSTTRWQSDITPHTYRAV